MNGSLTLGIPKGCERVARGKRSAAPGMLMDEPLRPERGAGSLAIDPRCLASLGASPRRCVPTGLLTGKPHGLPCVVPGAHHPDPGSAIRDVRGKEVNQLSQLRRIAARVREAWQDIDGQGLAEYALILALIAIVAIVAMIFLGQQVSSKLSVIGSTVQSVQ